MPQQPGLRPPPAFPNCCRRAEKIGAIARERATEFEKARQVSADLVEMMREQELFRIMQPKRFGGFEYGYDVFVEAVSAVASGDGSTGWVYSLGAVHPWMIGCYPDEAQHDFWRDSLDTVAAVSYAPTGKAVPESGGYRLSGRWSFASGVDNATWGIVGGIVPLADGPKPGFFLVPKADYTIHDDWNPMGLAGTGSKTIVISGCLHPGPSRGHIRRHADRPGAGHRGQYQSDLPAADARRGAALPGVARARHGARRAAGLSSSRSATARPAARWPAATTACRNSPPCSCVSRKRRPRSMRRN